jgi:hypothetical protein
MGEIHWQILLLVAAGEIVLLAMTVLNLPIIAVNSLWFWKATQDITRTGLISFLRFRKNLKRVLTQSSVIPMKMQVQCIMICGSQTIYCTMEQGVWTVV